jgi:hypothetical protein
VPLIDERGRLFGRVNLIDAFMALVVLGLIPLMYGAFLLFRAPAVQVVTISPQQVPAELENRVQVTGENFREALVATFGTILSPGFLILDSGRAEVIVPALPAGTYDFTLFDGANAIATVPNALTVVAPPPEATMTQDQPQATRIIEGMASLHVRFVAEPEVLKVMKAGDVDAQWGDLVLERDRAVLTGLGTDLREATALVIQPNGALRSFQLPRQVMEFTGTVRVPVIFAKTGWSYKDRPIKVGAPFTFDTTDGIMTGSIVEMKVGARR